MQNRYRLFRRAGGLYYVHDASTGKQESLRTRDKNYAMQMLNAKNQAVSSPRSTRPLRAYLSAAELQDAHADVGRRFRGVLWPGS